MGRPKRSNSAAALVKARNCPTFHGEAIFSSFGQNHQKQAEFAGHDHFLAFLEFF
jgi:muramoyltetrapeptide carboxypeptidase LdcA involved in peptidoglycan recycling